MVMDINCETGKRVSLFSLLKVYTRFSKVGGWGFNYVWEFTVFTLINVWILKNGKV